MRVAVHLPPGHPDHGSPESTEPVVVAFRLGRIEEGVHNAPIGHPAIPYDDFVAGLLSEAKVEYPDAEVRVEKLVDNGDGTSRWIPLDEFNPEAHAPTQPGNIKSGEFLVTSEQSTGDEG